jgi:ligand-binding sensor domain-containing protein/serine phosphatase RsbU (regulator of sigma subunit)
MRLRKILPFVFLLLLNLAFAQRLRFKHITSEDGLSTNFVKAIVQDDLGFMWFGTQDGLNKYDGYQIKVFKNDPTNPTSLSCSDITALAQVKQNLILIGTREGLNFFDPVTEKFSTLQKVDGRLNAHINTIFKLDENNALVGTEGGLFILNFAEKTIKNPYFKVEDRVNVKCIDRVFDEIFIGTLGKGLWKLNKRNALEKVEFVVPDYVEKINPANLDQITHIGSYGGKMYVGTYGFGIYKVDRSFEIEQSISFKKQNENSDFIKDFAIRNNKIFVASAWGVLVYNLLNEEVNMYTKQDAPLSLNSNPCNCIFSDNENNFWIGTDLGGVNISFFRSQKFPNSTSNIETEYTNIYAFLEDKKDLVWLGGVKTLHQLDLETGKSEAHNKILENGTALCIAKESEDIYWIGTWGDGVYRYDKKTKKSKAYLSPKEGGTILCLAINGDNLYAGSVGDGMFRINLKTFETARYTEKDGLPQGSINTIFTDSKSNVWLGTSDGGLVRMKGFESNGKLPIEKTYMNKGKLGEISSNMVMGINEDKGGNIWAATSTGLSKLLSNNTFHNFYSKDGLASTYLYSILKDSVGNFWMSSNSGIIRFNPQQPEKEIAFKNYGIKDGLVNTEYNMGAALAGPSGMMYFGGAKGFNAFRPSTIKDNLHAPNTYVIGYQRAGSNVETDSLITYKKHLTLSWRENYFQFELVAIDYTDPAKNKLKYMLEGYDADWSAPTSVRYVSYTQLPGGEYTFKVKAANNDGIWNEKPFEIRVTVVPPFWQTKAFYAIVIIVTIALIYFYTQYRTRAIKRENKILEGKVAERTRELEEKNRDITGSIQYAKRIQEAILPSKDQIYKKLKKVFILYQPKDIVSGDFYWFAEENGIKIFAVVDCTGHGVPGAFMSMIGHNLLHQIVLEKGVTDPGDILNHLHRGVQEALRQGHNEINTNDGMDVSIITISDKTQEVKWAGANRPLVLVDKNGELIKFDGNKYPIGGAQYDVNRSFTTHIVNPNVAAMAYMFSDGYADQFGGEKGKKFMVKRFHDLLGAIHTKTAEEQLAELKNNFEQWRLNHEQVDDVLIVGIEI